MLYRKWMRQLAIVFAGVFVLAVCAGDAVCAEKAKKKVKWVKSKTGLKSLIMLSKDRGDMVQSYKKETERHRKLKKAIDHHELKVGEHASKILKKYGPPVITYKEEGGTREKWAYKPGKETFLNTEKVYLIFDENETLLEWDVIPLKEKAEKPSEEKS
ncbi:MAG: hypothetical protein P9L88_03885 [Candidatus Tantalella remota]|nr:hypothetical protein [Candidatus Tantalella remota]